MVLLLCHPRKVFEFHCSEKHRGCPAAVQFCPDHPHLTPVSQQWKVNPTMTVWAQFMKTHQFYSTFSHPSPVQADGGIQSSHCQLQLCHLHLVIEWPRAGGTVSTLGHRDTSDLHKSSSEKLRGNSSAEMWAQRQLMVSQGAQPTKLIEQGWGGFEMMGHSHHSTHLAPLEPSWTQGAQAAARIHNSPTQVPHAKVKSPSHCPSHSPISLQKQGLELEAGKKNK